MSENLVLHEYSLSANCYKVRLTAALLDKPLDRREYDILKGETRTEEFLRRVNANGRIPVLQVGDRFIPESNAACHFVADGSSLIPSDPFDHADMLRWMFWEQYSHEPNIATLRFWMRWLGADELTELQRMQMPLKREQGNAALKLMDEHLRSRDWFAGKAISLADICLFAYTHVAGDAEFELERYPNVLAWIERVRSEPRFLPIDR
ncbi:MAG TPA: glutathione S-transferase family protein [Sphingomicrobium sp.]|nr:glutathione S-transferase family protein [Sphingomicrobium sp.]